MTDLGTCMHKDCWRKAVRIVSYEKPNHKEFRGQCHNCCQVHSKPEKAEEPEEKPADAIECSEPDCPRWIKSHAWGKIKAEDWFFEKNGKCWCPDHHPAWVAEWRARQRERAH
jgi:hypothetical protein